MNLNRMADDLAPAIITPTTRTGFVLQEVPQDLSPIGDSNFPEDQTNLDNGMQRAKSVQNNISRTESHRTLHREASLFALTDSDATHSLSGFSCGADDEHMVEAYLYELEEVNSLKKPTRSIPNQHKETPSEEQTEEDGASSPFQQEFAAIEVLLEFLNEQEASFNQAIVNLFARRGISLGTEVSPSSLNDPGEHDLPRQFTDSGLLSPNRYQRCEFIFESGSEAPPLVPPRSPARLTAATVAIRQKLATARPEKKHKRLSLLSRETDLKAASNEGAGVSEELSGPEPKGLQQKLGHNFSKLSSMGRGEKG
jgi:hypothetical protein